MGLATSLFLTKSYNPSGRVRAESRLGGNMETLPFRRIGMQLLAVGILLTGLQPAYGIPAFARKYGLPCSACHEAWPMLNNFGQTFKDNGYQLGNGRDAPIYKEPSYWPIMFQNTAFCHRGNNNRQAVDATPGDSSSGLVERSVTTSSFDVG